MRLGKSQLTVSHIGFGGIPIQRLTEEEAARVVRTCIDMGITFLDTANAYTSSEQRIGKAIEGQREHLVVATKSGSRDRAGMEKAANCSRCGDCEPRCPYNLPVMEMVEENATLYQMEKKKYLEQGAAR